MNKKGFEIGVNFLVVMILSIAILGMGFYMFNTLFEKTTYLQDSMTDSSKREIDSLLDTGEPVSIPRNARMIKAGDSEIFGLGIRNEGNNANFKVFADGSGLTTKYDASEITLRAGARTYVPIMVEVPVSKPRGSYVVDVEVCWNEGQTGDESCTVNSNMKRYYFKQKIFVNVP